MPMKMQKKILLTLAGFDPTSGAGASLDLDVFRSQGFRGMGILTSLTVQNTQSVERVFPIQPKLILEQYRSLRKDVKLGGIKVGMLGSKKNIAPVARILEENADLPRVVDPVFRSSSGTWLLEKDAIPGFARRIRDRATLITPNVSEAEWISGIKVRSVRDMEKGAEAIHSLTHVPCLVTGGCFGSRVTDVLFDGKAYFRYTQRKLRRKVHGTGCFLSALLLCLLASGLSLEAACSQAVRTTREAIKGAEAVGQGQQLIACPLEKV